MDYVSHMYPLSVTSMLQPYLQITRRQFRSVHLSMLALNTHSKITKVRTSVSPMGDTDLTPKLMQGLGGQACNWWDALLLLFGRGGLLVSSLNNLLGLVAFL